MKKMIALFLTGIILFCSGCDNHAGTQPADEKIQETKNEAIETTEKDPRPNLPAANIYVNEQCGYQFEFPENWIGWYFVSDENPQIATVRFYGKSRAGTVLEKEAFSADYGLTMFFILSEEEVNDGFYDSVTKIGTARGINYYFATTTDVSLAPLMDNESSAQEQLLEEDRAKAKEMMAFYEYENRHNLEYAFNEI